MSRNLLTDACPDCGRDWPTINDLSGLPVEFRQYAEGRSGDPVTPGVPWTCACGTKFFMWLSYGWAPGSYAPGGLPPAQGLPADASYYGSYNDEPGGSDDDPMHLAAPLVGQRIEEE